MKAPQQLPKPENWQDFESLCKKLWWEVWHCPEIKKNGRQGQQQNWIDIYGLPQGESQYYWIQCKGKDEYIHAQLTEREIGAEIEKAEKFLPKLKKMYFATTANKDSKIEEYVRKKNLEHKDKWLFEVHLYCREDIVDLIKENRHTYDYYVNSNNFLSQYAVDITFENWKKEINVKPIFLKTKKIYKHKNPINLEIFLAPEGVGALDDIKNQTSKMKKIIENACVGINYSTMLTSYLYDENKGENCSIFDFKIKISNIGTKQLDNLKAYLKFEWEIERINTYNPMFPIPNRYVDCYIWNDDKSWKLEKPKNNFLVPSDSYTFDPIYCTPMHTTTSINVNWELLSKDYNTNGKLTIKIIPIIIENEEIIEIADSEEEGEETVIENFYFNEKTKSLLEKNWIKFDE